MHQTNTGYKGKKRSFKNGNGGIVPVKLTLIGSGIIQMKENGNKDVQYVAALQNIVKKFLEQK